MSKVNANCIRQPAIPSPPVVPGGILHFVSDHESWETLARGAGLSDPWDLIRYNYPTLPANKHQAALEVNWYLERYVRCTKVTGDGKNYMFSNTGGLIFLPPTPKSAPPAAAPSGNHSVSVKDGLELAERAAIQTVLSIQAIGLLKAPINNAIDFSVGSIHVNGSFLRLVAKAIEDGNMHVWYVPTGPKDRFYYYHSSGGDLPTNTFEVTVPSINTPAYQALFIHEAVHAGIDLSKSSQTLVDSEAAAYLGGAAWASWHGYEYGSTDDIFQRASELADMLRRGRKLEESHIDRLRDAIRAHPDYKGRTEQVTVFDG